MTEQPKWLEKAKETYSFHRSKLMANDDWTIAKTAKSLRRSSGSISEDLLIAKFCKTHESDLVRFPHANEALRFIREKQKEQDLAELE